MKYNDVVTIAASLFNNDATAARPLFVSGPPGVGKTAMSYDIAAKCGIPAERVVIFRPSLRDPVDLLGVPAVVGGLTTSNPPAELARMQEGAWLLVIDELAQAVPMMQNALAGLMLDRFVGELRLSPEVRVMATGNRVQDRAGSNRIVSQLGNRVMHLEMEASVDDWVEWALGQGLDLMTIAFIRLKNQHLFDFDPNRLTNATPRAWEFVAKIDSMLPTDLYLAAVSGVVPEGIAAEYLAFRKLANKLPSIDVIMLDPANAELPEEPEVRYALIVTLSMRTTIDNFDGVLTYIERLPTEFQVLYMKSVTKTCPAVFGTKQFVAWASKNVAVFK